MGSPSVVVGGGLVVWGDDSVNQVTGAPTMGPFKKVAAGGASQSLALRTSGELDLWGTPTPAPGREIVPPLTDVVGERYTDVAISVSYAAAIRVSDGSIQTWGNFAGGKDASLPKWINEMKVTFSALTAGGGFCLAIGADQQLYQWGVHGIQEAPSGKFMRVAARNDYALALDVNGRLFAWGGSLFGPPGSGFPVISPTVRNVMLKDWQVSSSGHYFHDGGNGGPFKEIAAGGLQKDLPSPIPHVLALQQDGTVVGWGANAEKEISGAPGKMKAIAAGHKYSLGIDQTGAMKHWGSGGKNGLLAAVPPGNDFVSIGAATDHASAVRSSHVVSITGGG